MRLGKGSWRDEQVGDAPREPADDRGGRRRGHFGRYIASPLDLGEARIDEQLVVTIDGQLFYSVLSALPYLVNYPYECTEQTLNRFLSTGIVSSVFKAAVRDRRIMANPCEGTKLPKPERVKVVPPTTEQVELLREAMDPALRAVVTFTAGTGLPRGEVFGLTVRSRHLGSDIGASLKGLVGGEIKGYTKMLADSRLQAVERLRDAAREAGANAVIAMRFDCNELGGNMTEVAAYGTAVSVQRA